MIELTSRVQLFSISEKGGREQKGGERTPTVGQSGRVVMSPFNGLIERANIMRIVVAATLCVGANMSPFCVSCRVMIIIIKKWAYCACECFPHGLASCIPLSTSNSVRLCVCFCALD